MAEDSHLQALPVSISNRLDFDPAMIKPLGLVIFSSMSPRAVMGLISRLCRDVPGAKILGVVYELPRHKPFGLRCRDFVRNLKSISFVNHVANRLAGLAIETLASLGDNVLRFIHGTTGSPGGASAPDIGQLDAYCAAQNILLHVTADLHARASLTFTRALRPDLGVVFGTRILKPALFEIPTRGSINIHKRKVPEYRGGGPIGLWELLDQQTELGITVHRVTKDVDAGAVVGQTTIPIEPFDTLTSLALKADVVGNDLLVETISAFARGHVVDAQQMGQGRTFRKPSSQDLIALERRIAAERPPYRPLRGRPAWKLLARSAALAPWLVVRNWYRRLHGSFPVVILCHHIVTDQPHKMGISTHWYLKHVEFLQKHYDVISLPEAVDLLRTGRRLIRPAVVLTLDDGYAANYLNLRAISQATGAPMTLFVCSEKMTQQAEFDHDIKWGLSGFRPLTWEQAVALDQEGLQIASHTRTHFDCGSTQPEQLQAEIEGSQEDLEQRLGHNVDFFAFPWGKPENMSQPALALARATYSYVFSAFGGANFTTESGPRWHFKRTLHPSDLCELELALQSILDFEVSPFMEGLGPAQSVSPLTGEFPLPQGNAPAAGIGTIVG